MTRSRRGSAAGEQDDSSWCSRRRYLSAAVGAATGALAGCLEDPLAATPWGGPWIGAADWPQADADARRTSANVDAVAPEPDGQDVPLWRVDATGPEPLVVDGTVLVQDADQFRGVDLETGDVEWSHPLGSSANVPVAAAGDSLYLPTHPDRVRRLAGTDLAEGFASAELAVERLGDADVRRLTVTADRVLLQDSEYRVRALDAATLEELWTERPLRDPLELAATDEIVLCRGRVRAGVVALDAATGAERWRRDLALDRVALDGDRCYAVDEEGVLCLSLADGETRWRRDDLEGEPGSFALGPDALYHVSSSPVTAAALSPADGSVAWSESVDDEARFVGTPVLAGDALCWVDGGGYRRLELQDRFLEPVDRWSTLLPMDGRLVVAEDAVLFRMPHAEGASPRVLRIV